MSRPFSPRMEPFLASEPQNRRFGGSWGPDRELIRRLGGESAGCGVGGGIVNCTQPEANAWIAVGRSHATGRKRKDGWPRFGVPFPLTL